MLLAALNVRFRDVKYTIPFLTQIGLFVTPVIYPVNFLPHRYQWLLALNPMAGVIEGFRAVCSVSDRSIGSLWRLHGSERFCYCWSVDCTSEAPSASSRTSCRNCHAVTESITVQNLCKRYELGALQQETQLRDHLVHLLRAPFRRRPPRRCSGHCAMFLSMLNRAKSSASSAATGQARAHCSRSCPKSPIRHPGSAGTRSRGVVARGRYRLP